MNGTTKKEKPWKSILLVCIGIILVIAVAMTGSALPDNGGSEQLNPESTAVYVLDVDHHHLGDGVKPELLPTDAEDMVYTKIFIPDRIDGDTAGIMLTTKSVVPTDTAGIGLFYDLRLEIIPGSKYPYSENVRPPLRRIWSSSIGGYQNTPRPIVSESGEVIYYRSSQIDPDTHWMKQTINAIDARNGESVWSHETSGSWETGYARASQPAEEWNRTYEVGGLTSVESFQQTADSGYIIAGNTRSNAAFVLKTDSTGSEQWNRTFGGGTFSDDHIKSVLQTSDGGYLITGSTSTCMDNCTDDVWLIKMSTQGQEQWNLTLGGNNNEEVEFVKQTADGDYFLIGNTDLYGAGSSDIWFVKVDSNGNMQWNNTFRKIGQDKASSVTQVPGGYIIGGYTTSHGVRYSVSWLVKTDTKGEVQWNNIFRGIIGDEHSIQQTRDGGYIIAGITQVGVNHSDFLLVKTDSNGTKQWSKTFGGVSHEFSPSVRLSPDGGYILGGRTFSFDDDDYWLIKTDEDGKLQWDRIFKGRGFQLTSDGGYIIKGDLYDPLIIKTDSNGNEQWYIKMEWDELNSVLQTDDGGYILAGTNDSKFLLVKLIAERPGPSAQFTYDPGHPGANQTITFDASATHDPYGNITYYQRDLGGGIPAEPEDGDASTDGEPVQTPDIPGFEFLGAVFSVLIILLSRRRIPY